MTAAVQERIREAAAAKKSLRIAGRSNWLDAGRPVSATDTISLAQLTGVVDYIPGDLTITVRAGTSLAELAKVTAEQNQWLPLNPFGSNDGTIGATVSTASFGPFAHGFGTIRDLILGVEVVTGEAKVIRGGRARREKRCRVRHGAAYDRIMGNARSNYGGDASPLCAAIESADDRNGSTRGLEESRGASALAGRGADHSHCP